MPESPAKRCVVAYATRERQWLWTLELPAEATVQDALDRARVLAGEADVPWDAAPVGIFGEPAARSAVPRDGDRIELYRPLHRDPRESRRERVARLRAAGRGSGA